MAQIVAQGIRSLAAGILLMQFSAVSAQDVVSPRNIAAAARPAVVTIGAIKSGEVSGFGSGFIVRPDGLIATNLHVVQGADSLQVRLESGEIYDNVYVLGQDRRRDLIVLQIPATQLPSLELGDDRSVAVGDRVYAMGNPLGLEGTFSDGLLSAKRTEEGVSYLQITAPISPGSSGGPVFNEFGEVIAVATSTFTDAQNLNVAVPARYIEGMLSIGGSPVPFSSVAEELAQSDESLSDRIDTREVLKSLDDDTRAKVEQMEPWVQQVTLRLMAIQAFFQESGWEPLDIEQGAYLEAGDVDSKDVRLRRGSYAAVGICDDDCSDLDLAIFGPDGSAVGMDVELDAQPIVEFEVERRGRFTVGVSMESCETDSCLYAVQLLRQE